MKKILLLTAIVFFNLSLFASDTMRISIDNVSIEVPIQWLAQYTMTPQVFFLYSPMEKNDTFQENCNLVTEILPFDYSVEEYKEASLYNLKTVVTDFRLIENEGNYHIYSGYIGDINVMQIQYIYIKNLTAYVLTFTSNPENFDRYAAQFKTIAKSFAY